MKNFTHRRKDDYYSRLRKFEQAKRELQNKSLTAQEYERELRKLAEKYRV
jgi:hypothetical protein